MKSKIKTYVILNSFIIVLVILANGCSFPVSKPDASNIILGHLTYKNKNNSDNFLKKLDMDYIYVFFKIENNKIAIEKITTKVDENKIKQMYKNNLMNRDKINSNHLIYYDCIKISKEDKYSLLELDEENYGINAQNKSVYNGSVFAKRYFIFGELLVLSIVPPVLLVSILTGDFKGLVTYHFIDDKLLNKIGFYLDKEINSKITNPHNIKEFLSFINKYPEISLLKKKYIITKISSLFNVAQDMQIFVDNHPELKNNKEILNSLASLYRKQGGIEGFLRAYQISKDRKDIVSLSKQFSDADQMQIFVDKHLELKNKIPISETLANLYRKKLTLDGFYNAYRISYNSNDLISLSDLAKAPISLVDFISDKPDIKDNNIILQRLVGLYREQKNFEGYIKAFEISTSQTDIEKASHLAKNELEKELVEKKIVTTLNPNNFFKISIVQKTNSNLGKGKRSFIDKSIKYTYKDIIVTLQISTKSSNIFKIKYGKYEVKVKCTLQYNHSPFIQAGGFKDEKNIFFILNSDNNWNCSKEVTFKSIVFYGELYSTILNNAKSFAANLFGLKTQPKDFNIPFELTDLDINYEILSVK